eukprot:TRINITY_DN471_c0_g1_i1.p1 TRINITY_DN471_c0_g1~~TRINITY_DN471_c0_g1_i1.p1  ORF type:complete len:466 (+),score=100.79 TRINITY_DN471_c0_g1_i1:51-1448(+)
MLRGVCGVRDGARLWSRIGVFPHAGFSVKSRTDSSDGNGRTKGALAEESATPDRVVSAFGRVFSGFVDFEDTEKAFRPKSTIELATSATILRICQEEWLVRLGSDLLKQSTFNRILYSMVRYTFFRHFCAGEEIHECESVIERLNESGVGSIVDYAAEASEGGAAGFDQNAKQIMGTISLAARNKGIKFSCLKVSALCSTQFLHDHSLHLKNGGGALPQSLQADYDSTMKRLRAICDMAAKRQLPVLFDAEQTWYQPSIDDMTLTLCEEYNKERPIIYNTYQMYLKESLQKMKDHVQLMRSKNIHLGVKMVRGAYMEGERENATEKNIPSPILDNIQQTHQSYNDGIRFLISNMDQIGILIATHNRDSVEVALKAMTDHGVDPRESSITFAQLYGMADHISLTLGRHNIKVVKYVPFGPIREVIPYLLRRLEENSNILGGSAKERKLLWKELIRRLREDETAKSE